LKWRTDGIEPRKDKVRVYGTPGDQNPTVTVGDGTVSRPRRNHLKLHGISQLGTLPSGNGKKA
jgi:hypothetical protein